MVNVSVSLPDHLKDLIEAKVLEGGYGDSSQYPDRVCKVVCVRD
jgi:Arc/MetJ-type ribon-helix-helix transcriptional regulator